MSERRLARRFAELRAADRAALVVYLTAGHPDPERSVSLLQGIADAGADVIEIGVPFSDPMADGPVIQASSQRALEHGMTMDRALDLVTRADLPVPVVLFSYLNPVLAAGADFAGRAAAAGVDGLLVSDLPLGADPELEARLAGGPLDFVRLVAPTTPVERMREIGRHGSGFVYLISRLGVTGVRDDVPAELPEMVGRLRAATSLPVCVGFGISRPHQAAAVARMSDGVIVGSALVKAAEESVDAAVRLARELRQAMDDGRHGTN
ncbi:MAG TPA: tryptophan synthase subunit alpha [Gemmatimonadales bacterium]